MKLLAALFVLIGTLGGATYIFTAEYLRAKDPKSKSPVYFEVLPGTSLRTISTELDQLGLIKNSDVFFWYGRLFKKASLIKAGEYEISQSLSVNEIYQILSSGKSVGRPFTISEGLNIFEIAERFEKSGFGSAAEFLKTAMDPKISEQLLDFKSSSLEGYLYPETYHITRGTTAISFIKTAVETFKKNFAQAVPTIPDGWTQKEVVTLASIIEKETGAEFERPTISSVFHNRLKKKMRLQTDPTIIYGIALQTGAMPLNIRKSDLIADDPYNTYKIYGLPPGPISNPGAAALAAAVNPETSDYLFFVSQNDGTHVFSETYEEHNQAVIKFQRDPNARKGKSWRQLNEKENQK